VTEIVKIDERTVVELWERQAFDHAPLENLELRVVFRGVPSDAGGPDYQDAVLSAGNRQLIAGDVEFHVRASDWMRHGHHADRRYNNVILHVVWTCDITETRRQDGQIVPTLAVAGAKPFIEAGRLADTFDVLLPHPCIDSFGALSESELRRAIHRAGLLRFTERKECFMAEMEAVEPDQVAYSAILQALGYASNPDMFRRLAEIAPYAWLQSIPSRLWPHALLDAAGLGPRCRIAVPGRLSTSDWRLARLRPGNHPALRLVGAAQLLSSTGASLSECLRDNVLKADKPAQLARFLQVRFSDGSPIGAGRAKELSVSVVLPFVAALEPISEKPCALFSHHASPPRNKWTRLMENRFRAAGHRDFKTRGAIEHQGVHFLYHRFCRPERFGHCVCCGDGGMGQPSLT
jgi:Protein of unknown function (DUF2851)